MPPREIPKPNKQIHCSTLYSFLTASSMAENHHNFVAESLERNKKQENEKDEEKEEEYQERVADSSLPTESRTSSPTDEARPNPETLAVPSPRPHDHASDLQGSSTANEGGKVESKEPAGKPEKEIIVNDTVEAPQTQTENKLQVSGCSTSLSEPLPASVAQSLSSVPSPILPKQKLSPSKANGAEVDKRTPSSATVSPVSDARESASDGYNWRKYGQKQVKSPTGSRSYYRCSHSDCCAKKIKCCDQLGHVIEIVYKSQHNHDPPHKTNSTRESKLLPSTRESKLLPSTKEIKLLPSNEPNIDNTVTNQSIKVLSDFDPSPSPKEPLQEAPCSADRKRQNSSNGENGKVILREENVNEPEPKRRMKKGDLTCLDSPVKPGKKSKFVVHAAGDVGISGDGYRWRKYGQKMVKGNPRPRNYYRCTSAGCPVRKHIETAVDNSNALIITYKGVHDHDTLVPKKRHGPPSAPLVAAAAPASMNSLQVKRTDSMPNQKTSTQLSIDTEGELTREALDLGGEKAMESARTLLSIGIEIKPC